jgi:hypothetical protein
MDAMAECLRAEYGSEHVALDSAQRWSDRLRWGWRQRPKQRQGRNSGVDAVTAGQNRSHWQRCGIRWTAAAVRDMTRLMGRAVARYWDGSRTTGCGQRMIDGCEVEAEGAAVVEAGGDAVVAPLRVH